MIIRRRGKWWSVPVVLAEVAPPAPQRLQNIVERSGRARVCVCMYTGREGVVGYREPTRTNEKGRRPDFATLRKKDPAWRPKLSHERLYKPSWPINSPSFHPLSHPPSHPPTTSPSTTPLPLLGRRLNTTAARMSRGSAQHWVSVARRTPSGHRAGPFATRISA